MPLTAEYVSEVTGLSMRDSELLVAGVGDRIPIPIIALAIGVETQRLKELLGLLAKDSRSRKFEPCGCDGCDVLSHRTDIPDWIRTIGKDASIFFQEWMAKRFEERKDQYTKEVMCQILTCIKLHFDACVSESVRELDVL